MNPNTGTAPVFRTRRDADITRRIYASGTPSWWTAQAATSTAPGPCEYLQALFNMTSTTRTCSAPRRSLRTRSFYPVQGNRWKRGDALYLPLYQGRMIHQFDHRASSVRVNPDSTHNPLPE